MILGLGTDLVELERLQAALQRQGDALMTRLLEHNHATSMEGVAARDGRGRRLRVQIGPFPDEATAAAAQQNLRAIGYQAHLL